MLRNRQLGVAGQPLRPASRSPRCYDAIPATTEPRWVAIALTGSRSAPDWAEPPGAADVYDAKGLAEHTLEALGVRATTGEGGGLSGLSPTATGRS